MLNAMDHALTDGELELIDDRAHLAPGMIRADIGRLIAEIRRLKQQNEIAMRFVPRDD